MSKTTLNSNLELIPIVYFKVIFSDCFYGGTGVSTDQVCLNLNYLIFNLEDHVKYHGGY